MNYAIITTKVDPKIKKDAQKLAAELGVPLSAVIKTSLKEFIAKKTITLSAREDEIPNARTIRVLKRAEKHWKEGKVSPTFDNAEDAIAWLNDPKAKLKDGSRVQP